MSLKVAALKVLERNRARNFGATALQTPRNFDATTDKDVGLPLRIREMAARWQYSADELAEALSSASADTESWRRLIEYDEGGRNGN